MSRQIDSIFFQYIKEYILLNLPGVSENFPPLKNDNY